MIGEEMGGRLWEIVIMARREKKGELKRNKVAEKLKNNFEGRGAAKANVIKTQSVGRAMQRN